MTLTEALKLHGIVHFPSNIHGKRELKYDDGASLGFFSAAEGWELFHGLESAKNNADMSILTCQ